MRSLFILKSDYQHFYKNYRKKLSSSMSLSLCTVYGPIDFTKYSVVFFLSFWGINVRKQPYSQFLNGKRHWKIHQRENEGRTEKKMLIFRDEKYFCCDPHREYVCEREQLSVSVTPKSRDKRRLCFPGCIHFLVLSTYSSMTIFFFFKYYFSLHFFFVGYYSHI